jgi:hypothetical protein
MCSDMERRPCGRCSAPGEVLCTRYPQREAFNVPHLIHGWFCGAPGATQLPLLSVFCNMMNVCSAEYLCLVLKRRNFWLLIISPDSGLTRSLIDGRICLVFQEATQAAELKLVANEKHCSSQRHQSRHLLAALNKAARPAICG